MRKLHDVSKVHLITNIKIQQKRILFKIFLYIFYKKCTLELVEQNYN